MRRESSGAIASSRKGAGRRSRPLADKTRERRDKLSISLDPADVRWVTRRARDLGKSVSAVLADAIAEQRRADATAQVLSMLGGTDDLSPDLVERARAEMLDP